MPLVTECGCRRLIGHESEPVEIIEQRQLIFLATATAVMILDAQQHASAECAREPPYPDGVDGMAEVEIARRCGRESRGGADAYRWASTRDGVDDAGGR